MNFSWGKLIRHLSENVLKNVRICEDFPASFALIISHSSRSTQLFHQPCILAHRVLFHDFMRISRVEISIPDCLPCVAKSGSELFLKIVEWLDGTNPTWWITSSLRLITSVFINLAEQTIHYQHEFVPIIVRYLSGSNITCTLEIPKRSFHCKRCRG